jgi:hypothetical protein
MLLFEVVNALRAMLNERGNFHTHETQCMIYMDNTAADGFIADDKQSKEYHSF